MFVVLGGNLNECCTLKAIGLQQPAQQIQHESNPVLVISSLQNSGKFMNGD